MRRYANVTAVAALVLGVLVAFGYAGWCFYGSGTTVGKYAVRLDQPLELALDPAMNPLRFVVRGRYRSPVGRGLWHQDAFVATLYRGGQEVWRGGFVLWQREERKKQGSGIRIRWGQSGRVYTASLRAFRVDRAGRYELLMQRAPESPTVAVDLTVELVRNVQPVNWAIVLGAMAAAAAGLVWLIVMPGESGPKRQPDQDNDDTELIWEDGR